MQRWPSVLLPTFAKCSGAVMRLTMAASGCFIRHDQYGIRNLLLDSRRTERSSSCHSLGLLVNQTTALPIVSATTAGLPISRPQCACSPGTCGNYPRLVIDGKHSALVE